MTLDQRYRNGGPMNENEPYVPDTCDWFARAARDERVVANQLKSMGQQQEEPDDT